VWHKLGGILNTYTHACPKMKTKKRINVVVLEEQVRNSRLLKQLHNYTAASSHNKYKLAIQAYSSMDDCVGNLKKNTDLLFTDYFLWDKTALELLPEIKQKCNNCKVVVMSDAKNLTISLLFQEGVTGFLNKSSDTFSNHVIEDIVSTAGD
jgi:response regulator of citrate/malate metabolism